MRHRRYALIGLVLLVGLAGGCQAVESLVQREGAKHGVDARTTSAIYRLAVQGTIEAIRKRSATEREKEEARERARNSEDLTESDREVLKEKDVVVAVPVEEGEDSTGFILVDPETNEPVNETVYEVKNEDVEDAKQEQSDSSQPTVREMEDFSVIFAD